MAAESSSKKCIFKDVRFFLADENNEEVCDALLSAKSCKIALREMQINSV